VHPSNSSTEASGDTVRWITAENDYRDRAKSDRVAGRTPWIIYDVAPVDS
jgi:hypothetical protein